MPNTYVKNSVMVCTILGADQVVTFKVEFPKNIPYSDIRRALGLTFTAKKHYPQTGNYIYGISGAVPGFDRLLEGALHLAGEGTPLPAIIAMYPMDESEDESEGESEGESGDESEPTIEEIIDAVKEMLERRRRAYFREQCQKAASGSLADVLNAEFGCNLTEEEASEVEFDDACLWYPVRFWCPPSIEIKGRATLDAPVE